MGKLVNCINSITNLSMMLGGKQGRKPYESGTKLKSDENCFVGKVKYFQLRVLKISS